MSFRKRLGVAPARKPPVDAAELPAEGQPQEGISARWSEKDQMSHEKSQDLNESNAIVRSLSKCKWGLQKVPTGFGHSGTCEGHGFIHDMYESKGLHESPADWNPWEDHCAFGEAPV